MTQSRRGGTLPFCPSGFLPPQERLYGRVPDGCAKVSLGGRLSLS